MNLKNNITHLSNRGVVFLFLILFFTLFSNNDFAYSTTIEELKDQIQKVTETRQQLEQEIAVYEKQLKDIGDEATSLKNTIKSLNVTMNKNSLDIKLTQSNIDKAQLEIEELSIDISKGENTIKQNTKVTASLLQELNAHDSFSIIENILTYKNLSDFWNEEQNIYLIQNQIREKTAETIKTKSVLEKDKTNTEQKKKDLLNLKSDLLDKKKLLDITKAEKNKLLADTKNSEANYKKILEDKKALADAFDKELLQFESELKTSIDPTSFPSVGKGILSWPLDIIKINQKFGYTDFAKTGFYKGAPHNGVDFAASIGTDIKASLSGIVRGIGDTDVVCPAASFGQWVFIEHNNGLSTIYAHLSLIKVRVGQIVTTGDVIGFSGYSGSVYPPGPRGAHLHFGVYSSQGVEILDYKSKVRGCGTYRMPVLTKKGAYLDPLQYL